MMLLWPLGLLLAGSLGVLVVFYLLKIQPADREVGSTYLWERLLPDVAAHQPWQRPRFPTLFFIQAALLLALALAAARPAHLALAPASVSAVFVLDATASMGATDVAPSRFERARALARATLDELPEGSRATLVVAGARAAVLVAETSDRAAFRAALDRAQPTDAAGDLGAALDLAAALAQGGPAGRPGRVEVFTDGALDLPADRREIAAPIAWHLVGGPAENAAITGFAARADPANQRRQQVYLRVERTGGEAPAVSATLTVDGLLHESRRLTFDQSGRAEAVFDDLPDTARVVEATLAGADSLPVDDRATLVLDRPRGTRVLLVSRGDVFLERALGLVPHVELDRVLPRRFGAIVPEDYDVVVFDTDVPDVLPSRPMLVVNPAGSSAIPVDGLLRRPSITAWERDHPLLRHVDLSEVRLVRAPLIQPTGWARAIVESDGAPLILAGEEQGQRVVVLGLDLHQSNLPLTAAFPILIANAVGYLEPPGFLSASVVAPGGEVALSPAPEARSVVVRAPTGRETILSAEGGGLAFAETERVGLYRVEQRDGERLVAESAFAVNLLDAGESNLAPRPLPTGQPVGTGAPRLAADEWWRWLLGAALVGLVVEWAWYHRR